MGRHRGVYDPSNPEPYELSRSKLEAFVRCPAHFWLEKRTGVKFPSMLTSVSTGDSSRC